MKKRELKTNKMSSSCVKEKNRKQKRSTETISWKLKEIVLNTTI